MLQVWGSLVIFLVCPLLGALPLIEGIALIFIGRKLSSLGTGNVSVSAAFYHGGKVVGILAVLSEAAKGIAAVLLARAFFPVGSGWELVALLALVVGRYWGGKGAGTTNVVWGITAHDPIAAFLIFLIGGISFTIFRDRASGRLVVLILLALILSLRHAENLPYIAAAIALSGLMAWIFATVPDDLDLPQTQAKAGSRKMFRFFQGDKTVVALDRALEVRKAGRKAATLAQLKRWGYPVPDGWVLPAGDDAQPLIQSLAPSPANPLVVRSSAVGEDSETASAAGQYVTVLNVTSRAELEDAITQCQMSYNRRSAARYRRDFSSEVQNVDSLSVLVQRQIRGVFSGVAFSRDPVDPYTSAIAVEALPGDAARVVSGRTTPEQYRVFLPDSTASEVAIEGSGDVPSRVIQEAASLARELEGRYHGIPQDIEWTYDGETLWLLQARPIATLRPIWTRKIAAEVIPGAIRPLTWSINRPLTCGVWGDIFTIVLGDRAAGLDFAQTATLHYSHAYFNATLLGTIFRRMGLPPESLEFLTRGSKLSKPPLLSTLRNLPGLLKLWGRERRLERDFQSDRRTLFAPTLTQLAERPASQLSPPELFDRIDTILLALRRATYYSILAPLSAAVRQSVLSVDEADLDASQTPEIASARSLARIAQTASDRANSPNAETLLDDPHLREQFEQWLHDYGYLSAAATDIAVPRWRDNPEVAKNLLTQYLKAEQSEPKRKPRGGWKANIAQRRLDLKGKVAEVYSRLLAHLRWSFLALEEVALKSGWLEEPGDIFLLELTEIRHLFGNSEDLEELPQLLQQRRSRFHKDRKRPAVPFVVYGDAPATPIVSDLSSLRPQQKLQGIAASPGQAEGRVQILRDLQDLGEIDEETILVVPYTDAGWGPFLARAGGLIAEVGGRLSHGAIVAREYGIPAVMDVANATQILREGQRVRIDGRLGTVEILRSAQF